MFTVDNYSPTRVIFGFGRLKELATVKLPGKKALICVTSGKTLEKLGIQQRVLKLLNQNKTEAVIFNKVEPNPTCKCVMEAAAIAKKNNCDFLIGLGGGSSIDTAKAAAIMMKNTGNLWDYAAVGTGGKKEVKDASPVVAITTTAGTGTETNLWCVITNEDTKEKLDFGIEKLYPVVSIIDPELMISLPKSLTAFQGLDALFHAVECYICNAGQNRLVSLYAEDAIKVLTKWLPVAVNNGSNMEARLNVSYAASILGGYIQSLTFVTSHHIIGQTMSGLFPAFIHGATLIVIAEAYYMCVKKYIPEVFDELGSFMGETKIKDDIGQSYINGLIKILSATGMREISMSQYGVKPEVFRKIADITIDVVGIDFDHYRLSKQDIVDILDQSYR